MRLGPVKRKFEYRNTPEPPRSGKRLLAETRATERALADALAEQVEADLRVQAAGQTAAEIRRLAAAGVGQTRIAAHLRVPYRVVEETLRS